MITPYSIVSMQLATLLHAIKIRGAFIYIAHKMNHNRSVYWSIQAEADTIKFELIMLNAERIRRGHRSRKLIRKIVIHA